jgi:hypothetical protein
MEQSLMKTKKKATLPSQPLTMSEALASLQKRFPARIDPILAGITSLHHECVICKKHIIVHQGMPHFFIPLLTLVAFGVEVIPGDLKPGDVVVQGYWPAKTVKVLVIRQ